jgi:hypothetical protein
MMSEIDVSKLPVVMWPIEKLIPYEKNAKKHPEEQIRRLAESIAKLGLAQPVHVEPDGTVIAGHGRRLAFLYLKRGLIPVVVRTDLTKAQADALRISENKTTSTEWDVSLLQEEARRLAALTEEQIDLSMLGLNEAEQTALSPEAFGEMTDEVFIEDISEAVETQKADNKKAQDEIDKSAAPVADALGFKRVTVEQSRQIRSFMNRIEAESGKKGVEALLDHIAAHV